MKRVATQDPEIWKIGDVFWYRKHGRELSLKTRDFKTAVQNKRAALLKIDNFGVGTLKLRVKDVVDDYIESRIKELKRNDIRASTFKETKDIFNRHLLPYFGKYPLHKITSPLWDKYRAEIKADVTNHRKIFGHFLKWCKKQGYIKYLPDMDVNSVERRKRRILTNSEIALIYEHSQGSLRLFIALALFLGMRRSEIMFLTWDRVDFGTNTIFLDKEHTKTKQSRWIPISALARKELKLRKDSQALDRINTRFVFPNALSLSRPGDVNGLKTAWKTCKKRAGLDSDRLTWHDLRATCEYYAHKRKDLTPTQLEKFFGSNIEIQRKIYVTFDADDVRGVENSVEIQALTDGMGKTRVKGKISND